MDRSARKRTNSSSSISLPTSSLTTIRRRRLVIWTVVVLLVIFCFGVPWELPATLKDIDVFSINRGNIAQVGKPKVDEIFGLLHLVTGDEEHESHSVDLNPTKPINMNVYAAGLVVDWNKVMQDLNKQFPIVVFSKTYCPFSTRAKALLESYDLRPRPKIIEVDLRDDADLLGPLLMRLTKRSTFPNTIIRGKSIGGSDDLHALHADGSLRKMIEGAGVVVGADGVGRGVKAEGKT